MPWWSWSQTSSLNATADPTINWAEGQAPSSVNDSARAVMSASAMYRDDIAGAIVTGGTSTAYTVFSFSVFDTFAHLNGQMIAFSPHATNGATVTLNVDGLGAKPLRSAPNVELLAGTIIQGTPYTATYNNTDGAFYLQGFFGNPYNIPLGGGVDYWLPTAPNSSFVFPTGQAISRTTYATLFAAMGTTFGTGDGSTTFNLPDKTGRVSAMQEVSATRLTSTYFGGNSTVLGAIGGSDNHGLSVGEQANMGVTVTGTATVTSISTGSLGSGFVQGNGISSSPSGGTAASLLAPAAINQVTSTGSISGTGTATGSGGSTGAGHANVQPTIVCNYILRII